MTMIFDGSNGLTMQTWTTTSRPASPVIGQTGFNTTYNGQEVYNGSAWTLINGGPAFSAYMGSNQNVSNNTDTKLQVNTKEFDTANCYNNSTYRFTPTVPGYYQINGQAYFYASGGINGNCFLTIYKNGSRFKDGTLLSGGSATIYFPAVSTLIYFNGTTDYVELYGNIQGSGTLGFYTNTPTLSYFQGNFVRGA